MRIINKNRIVAFCFGLLLFLPLLATPSASAAAARCFNFDQAKEVTPCPAIRDEPDFSVFYQGSETPKDDTCYTLVVSATESTSQTVGVPGNCDELVAKLVAQKGANETIERQPDPDEVCVLHQSDATACSQSIFDKYINPAVNFLTVGVGIVVIGMIIVGGIQYSSSAGDAAKMTAAKQRIFNALLALLAFIFMRAFLAWIVPGGL